MEPVSNETQSSTFDEEASQALARVIGSAIAVPIIFYFSWQQGLNWHEAYSHAIPLVLVYGVLSSLWLRFVQVRPGNYIWRRLTTVVGDIGLVSFAMVEMGETGVVFYPLFLWVIVGNGFRFGTGYLLYAMAVGQVAHIAIYNLSNYWHDNPILSTSLQAGTAILPLFYLSVLKRLHALNGELKEVAEQATMAAESKSQFLANMSHELRTPMNGVIGVTHLLLETPLNERQREYVELIFRSADNLVGLINAILDFSKINAEKLVIESTPFDLKTAIADVVNLLEPNAEEKGISLSCAYPEDAPVWFCGDRSRVRQVLMNLVGNAIKFTDRGRVTVDCRIQREQDNRCDIEIDVRDTGVGIDENDLQRIFEQFEQADGSTFRRFGGTGLGLSISRGLAQAMDGTLTASSTKGQGSCFTLRLKLPSANAGEKEQPNSATELQRDYGIRALVAEDNRVNQIVAQGLLSRLGIEVDLAENGEMAVQTFDRTRHQLVFMDLQMPKLDGRDAAQLIRDKEQNLSQIPVVAMSANVATSSRKDDEALFDAYVAKPINPRELVRVVDQLLER